MDHAFDSYFWNNNDSIGVIEYPEFIYDNKRIFAKLYVFFKSFGLIFYMSTLSSCNIPDFYISMILVMFLSTINSARYEYAHFKRYGTIFSSLNEYEEWKKEQYPKLRIFFSSIELAIKIVFFIRTFPPQREFHNLCEIGESVFKIHILAILMIYIIIAFFFICFLCSCYGHNFSNNQRNIQQQQQQQTISLPIPILVDNNQNEECCICMDNDNNSEWAMLSCAHKFHGPCISTWLLTNQTCPICRLDFRFT
jgi:hypothetical protein